MNYQTTTVAISENNQYQEESTPFDYFDASMRPQMNLGGDSMESYVRNYFAATPILAEIARCESHFRQYDKTGVTLQGRVDNRDTGLMQINTGYHGAAADRLKLDLTKPADNLAYAQYLYDKQGLQPWMSSYPCWSKALPQSQTVAVK